MVIWICISIFAKGKFKFVDSNLIVNSRKLNKIFYFSLDQTMMVRCRFLMLILVINIGIKAAYQFPKSDQPVLRIATLMKSLEKIDRRISSSGKELREDFSQFRMKVTGEYAWKSDMSDKISTVKSLIEWLLVPVGLIVFILFFWRLLLSHKYVFLSCK